MRFFCLALWFCGAARAEADVGARLPFLPMAEALNYGQLVTEIAHRFDGEIAPAGERNLFAHALGMDDPGNTALQAAYGLSRRVSVSLGWETQWQTLAAEIRFAALQESEGRPLSLIASWNAESRWADATEADKKYSLGGALTVQHSFFDAWRVSAALAAQSNTNIGALGNPPDHSLAAVVGLLRQGETITVFGAAAFPLRLDGYGYRRAYASRAPNGIPPLAFGFSFGRQGNTLDVLCANTTSMLPGNFLAGADAPTPTRLMLWRLGLSFRHAFALN